MLRVTPDQFPSVGSTAKELVAAASTFQSLNTPRTATDVCTFRRSYSALRR